MRILVLGSGAREHAIITALLRDGDHSVVAAPGNAGIAQVVETVRVDQNDGELVARLATDLGAELVVIGPEAPLVAGVADAVRAVGIPVFGPSRQAAQLEGSKAFAKRIMDAANVPTGSVTRAETVEEAAAALDAVGAPYVVKADGLAAGKGVIVTSDRDAAADHARYWLSHGPVLVEEFLQGPEVSLFLLSDGTTVRPLAPAQDFKRLQDGDEGPNTGGMGAYSPLPWLEQRFGGEQAFVDEVVATIAQPTIDALRAEGTPFVGLLYCGLIVTDAGIKVIEFNARFGDPETQVVLPRLTSPFGAALHAAATGALAGVAPLEFGGGAAVTVVVASEGYPDDPQTGRAIAGIADADALEGVHVMHAATVVSEEHGFVATGGRVLSVVGSGATLAQARERAYAGVEVIRLEGSQARTDIARAAAEA
ncbi:MULTISPECIES: phosphoribosylamine--glycine ligase [unclassified Agrococcus]|uniref:phosphoribosylamine--glycine ligase n=1 Tax=unclassified Agrococcus TaxID=2615065 RepID=UPI00360C22E3